MNYAAKVRQALMSTRRQGEFNPEPRQGLMVPKMSRIQSNIGNYSWSEPGELNQGPGDWADAFSGKNPWLFQRPWMQQRPPNNWFNQGKPSYQYDPDAYRGITASEKLGLEPRTFNALTTFGRNPWVNGISNYYPPSFAPPSGNLPGSWQGPTYIPTYFNSQGYPYAVPTSDYGFNSGSRHMGQKKGK